MIYVDMVAITDKRFPLGIQKERKAEIWKEFGFGDVDCFLIETYFSE